jgi:hypothetical protein
MQSRVIHIFLILVRQICAVLEGLHLSALATPAYRPIHRRQSDLEVTQQGYQYGILHSGALGLQIPSSLEPTVSD